MRDNAVTFPAPGHKEQALLTFDAPLLADYQWPHFAINGAKDGPTLILIAGIHGAEYPPIDAVMRFCRSLDPASLLIVPPQSSFHCVDVSAAGDINEIAPIAKFPI